MENQPIVRLTFSCNRNWEDMAAVEGGRFCNDCQKKVIDFTNKTSDEIAAYLMSSTTQVCGRFTASQLAPGQPKTFWKHWLSAAAMFAVFMGIKEASAQITSDSTSKTNKENKVNRFPPGVMGEVTVTSYAIPVSKTTPAQEVTSFGVVEGIPSFPGGEKALNEYIRKNLHNVNEAQGRVITTFVIEKDGSLTDIKVLRGLSKEADEEAVRVLKASPKWQPAVVYDVPVRKAYTMPINFGQ